MFGAIGVGSEQVNLDKEDGEMSSSTLVAERTPADAPKSTFFEQLVNEINQFKASEADELSDTESFVLVSPNFTKFWTDLFVKNYVCKMDKSQDDLLFFVRKRFRKGYKNGPNYETLIEVYRKESRKLPIGDLDVDWEETLYLNLIMQEFEYTLTCAVCTRTSVKDFQILKKHSHKVYASPSRRSMDGKGEVEEITYPNIFFTIDDYEELLDKIVVQNGEMITIELVAKDRIGRRNCVLFLGCISYDSISSVYDSKSTAYSRGTKRSWTQKRKKNRMEFVKMRGPGSKGSAEMAVNKISATNIETPTSDPGYSITDFDCGEMEDHPYSRRRMSDPSSVLKVGGIVEWRRVHKSRSESEGVDRYANGMKEIEAEDLQDDLSNEKNEELWKTPGFVQAYFNWKESKRSTSPAFQAYLTYISVPWHYIVADVLNSKQEPVLIF